MQDEMLMHVRELPDYINIVKFWNTRPHTPPPPPSNQRAEVHTFGVVNICPLHQWVKHLKINTEK